MSSKDGTEFAKNALLSTKPGRRIFKQGLIKSKGYKLFIKYKNESQAQYPGFLQRFTSQLHDAITHDASPQSTQQTFANEINTTALMLPASKIDSIKSKLENKSTLHDRVQRILDSNFIKMTFPVFNALFDGAASSTSSSSGSNTNTKLKQDIVEGHMIAIDLSEPMDRIIDQDEDIPYLDDYKLMNPYILQIAREKISKGGDDLLKSFEAGLQDAQAGQLLDEKLKSSPQTITAEALHTSYKKYRAVMGTAGKNMALSNKHLGNIFYLGMAHTAESAGCGNEIADSIKNGFVKIPSWPLYYSQLANNNNAKIGFKLTLQKSDQYLQDAHAALDLLPSNFEQSPLLEFLFATIQHYNHYWYHQLSKFDDTTWNQYNSKLPSHKSGDPSP